MCAHSTQEVGRQDVWLSLLDVYLRPGDGREPDFNAAVRLLQAHATNLNPLEVLNALSEDMPLQIALPHIEKMLMERKQRSLQVRSSICLFNCLLVLSFFKKK